MADEKSGLWAGIKRLIAAAQDDGRSDDGRVDHDVGDWGRGLAEFAASRQSDYADYKTGDPCPTFETPQRADVLELIGRAAGRLAIDKLYQVAVTRVDSPIEELMLYGLVLSAQARSLAIEIRGPAGDTAKLMSDLDYRSIKIQVHPKVAGLTPDFVVTFTDPCCWDKEASSSMAIECDGHDFHEKTKHQAARDKKRDREIIATGLSVTRFAGSEIWADPIKHGLWVVDTLEKTVVRRRFEDIFKEGGLPRFLEMFERNSASGWFEKATGRTMKQWAEVMGFPIPAGKP